MRISFETRPSGYPGEAPVIVRGLIQGAAEASALLWPVWKLPPLYRSGIRYAKEPGHGSGNEEFCLPWQTYLQRWGDCDDLTIYRIAELIAHGEKATCHTTWDHGDMHVLVRRANGETEDPSIVLGALGPI